MSRRMRVGVQLPEVEWEVSAPELLAMARTAEEVGFDSVWVGDHLLYDLPIGPRGPWEAWTSLAAIAAVTTHIALGPLVASTSFHQPAMLAKQAATVDAISQGRLVLGLGAGWNEREYRAFGFPFDQRVARFEEAFTIIRTLLRAGEIDFEGDFYRVENCVLHPRVASSEGPPIIVGSTGPRMLSIALPYVSGWNAWYSAFNNDAELFARTKARVDVIATSVGRDPQLLEASCAVLVRAPGGSGRLMGSDSASHVAPVSGDQRAIAEQLRAFSLAGANHVQLVVDPITRSSIEWLGGVLLLLDSLEK